MKKILVILVALICFGISANANARVKVQGVTLKCKTGSHAGYTLNLSSSEDGNGTASFFCGSGCERSGSYKVGSRGQGVGSISITFTWTSGNPIPSREQVGQIFVESNGYVRWVEINRIRYER